MTNTEFLSRNEKILHKGLGEDIATEEPQSPIEELLSQLVDAIELRQEYIIAAVNSYFDEHGIDTITDEEIQAEIQEALNG